MGQALQQELQHQFKCNLHEEWGLKGQVGQGIQ